MLVVFVGYRADGCAAGGRDETDFTALETDLSVRVACTLARAERDQLSIRTGAANQLGWTTRVECDSVDRSTDRDEVER